MSTLQRLAHFERAHFHLEFKPITADSFRDFAYLSILIFGGGLTAIWAIGLSWLVGYALGVW